MPLSGQGHVVLLTIRGDKDMCVDYSWRSC